MKELAQRVLCAQAPSPCLPCETAFTPGHSCVQCLCKNYFPPSVLQEHRANCIPRGTGIGSKDISRVAEVQEKNTRLVPTKANRTQGRLQADDVFGAIMFYMRQSLIF